MLEIREGFRGVLQKSDRRAITRLEFAAYGELNELDASPAFGSKGVLKRFQRKQIRAHGELLALQYNGVRISHLFAHLRGICQGP
mmetsp:Transcript_4112/g.6301  ORF Transcript_4112/g.6301 Transcript_4112/m.6301 type:complete len:85 (-) Transcript_4112:832-1086(-)